MEAIVRPCYWSITMVRIYLSIACTLISVVCVNALDGGYMYHIGLLFSGSCFGAMMTAQLLNKGE